MTRLLLAFVVIAFVNAQPPRVAIVVHANQRTSFTIPRTIFGSFLEPIGNSTYNGLWAELLQNPSLEENLWSVANLERLVRDNPALQRASHLALPIPWEPLDPSLGNRYEPRWNDAANSARSLAVLGLAGHATGIKQQVFLPIHREHSYRGSVYLKHLSGPARIDVSLRLRNRPDQILCRANLDAASGAWTKYSFALDVPEGRLHPLEPADFVIQVSGDERVLVDQVSLTPADVVSGLDPEMLALSKAMRTPLVRFGGNFTSAYHWRDGIGPTDKRTSMLNIAWGMPEYNQFGTDEFLEFCRLIGAQPQIALNLGSGTPQEAAEWVQYVNEHWTPRSGLLWELGNELWGNWNLGYPVLEELPARTLAFSQAIRAVDPHARLIATGQDPDVYPSWNAAQLTNPPGTFDFLSTHFVVTTDRTAAPNTSPDAMALDAFALPVELGRRLRAMQSQIDQSAHKSANVHLAFTEWLFICCGEGALPDAPRYDNLGGAIATAGLFNMFIQNAAIVPVSDMTGIIEFGGIWKKRGRVFGTPAYYAFRLYSTADASQPVAVTNNTPHYEVHSGITRLPEIAAVPYLEVVATLNAAGDRLTLFCVNRELHQDLPARIALDGFRAAPTVAVQTLSAASVYAANDEEQPERVVPVPATANLKNSELLYTFPRASVTRLELDAAR
jgi:alpha-N-arabinofuranosidase